LATRNGRGASSDMDFHRLNVFITAAQYMSFTKAAKHLHIAQSAVSHDIAELEKELGAKLFTRTRTGIVFTPAGEIFFAEACKMIVLSQGVKRKIEKIVAGEDGDLRFGFVAEQMVEPLMPFLKLYHEKHPRINLQFNSDTSIAVSRRILNGDFDFGLGRNESFSQHEGTEWRHLYYDPFCLGVPETHRLAAEKAITMDMIADETIILMSSESNPGFFELVRRLYFARDMTPLLNTTSNDRMATIMMARMGMGLVLLTKQFFKGYDFDNLVLIPLAEKDAFHQIGVAWRKQAASGIAEQFLRELWDYLQENPIDI
jgi:DNA-binding transcriptional LysR family regulator